MPPILIGKNIMENLESWQDGLCREFTKAVREIIRIHKISEKEYDLDNIGYEIIRLYEEIFDEAEIDKAED